MEAPFYIGQEIVCIESHTFGDFLKGQEFKVFDIKRNCCGWVVNIGINTLNEYRFLRCRYCGKESVNDDYYDYKRFAPKQSLSEMTYNEAINLVSNPVLCHN